jgi:hypothetical protein
MTPVLFFIALPAHAQNLFPRFSVSGGAYLSRFSTDVRADSGTLQGTQINAERDLGLTASKHLRRYTLEWRPFERHQLEASYFEASRAGFRAIDGPIIFNGHVYPASADVTTHFGLKYADLSYTGWVHRSDVSGFGVTLGVARISVDASLLATRVVTITEKATTSVPVAMIGAQTRFALGSHVVTEVRAATLPKVHIDVYSGRAVIGNARLELRLTDNIGIGTGYNYSRISGDVTDPRFGGNLAMTIEGAEAYLRFAFGR